MQGFLLELSYSDNSSGTASINCTFFQRGNWEVSEQHNSHFPLAGCLPCCFDYLADKQATGI